MTSELPAVFALAMMLDLATLKQSSIGFFMGRILVNTWPIVHWTDAAISVSGVCASKWHNLTAAMLAAIVGIERMYPKTGLLLRMYPVRGKSTFRQDSRLMILISPLFLAVKTRAPSPIVHIPPPGLANGQ
jgi:hypothetical protein